MRARGVLVGPVLLIALILFLPWGASAAGLPEAPAPLADTGELIIGFEDAATPALQEAIAAT